ERVRHAQALVGTSVHKRKMPLIPKLGARTVGLDWREGGSPFLEGSEEPFGIVHVEDDLRRGEAEGRPKLPRTSKPDGTEGRPTAGDEEGRLHEGAMDSQRHSGQARLLRSGDGLDGGARTPR